MSVSNTSRFTIYKNAIEYIKEVPTLIAKNNICTPKDYTLKYSWDSDFKQFFRIDSQKAEAIVKTYPDTDLLLQNIYWDEVYFSVENVILEILEKIAKTGNQKKLSIINISPLEWAIVWKIFKELGLKNIVFNFNRSLWVNSTSKTLEAILYLFSYENSSYFRNKTAKIVKNIQDLELNLKNDNNYIIIDENNNTEKYAHLSIDNYLKHQIGEKEPKNIYRIDKYPDEAFLIGKGIQEIIVFDNDSDYGQAYFYYEKILNTLKLKKDTYTLIQRSIIGHYEDYLIGKDREYKNYKKEIEQKAYNSYKIYENTSKTAPQRINKNIYLENRKSEQKEEKDYKIVPYILFFPILIIAFLMADTSPSGNFWNSSGNSGNGWYYYGGSVWWWDGSNTTISTKKTESKSIIKSFGGWGFSKWST